MRTDWFKDLPKEQQEDRKAMVKSAQPTLKVLKSILDKMLDELETERSKKAHYDSPAWAYLQADNNGAVRALKRVIDLLDQEDK